MMFLPHLDDIRPHGVSAQRLEGAARLAVRVLDAASAAVCVRNEEGWARIAAHGYQEAATPPGVLDQIAESPVPLIVGEGFAQQIGRTSSDPDVPGRGRVYAGFPLTDADGNGIGVLVAVDDEPETFSAPGAQALGDVANLAASELESMRYATALGKRGRILDNLLQSLTEIVWVASLDGSQIRYMTRTAEEIYGRPVDDFYDNPNLWLEVVHPDDQERVKRESRRLLKDQQVELEYRILRPNGEVRHLRDRKHVIYDSAGNVAGIGGTAKDMTPQRKAEDEMHESEARFRRIFEQSPLGIAIVDERGWITGANEVLAQLIGCEPTWIEGRHFAEITHPEDVRGDEENFAALFEGTIDSYRIEKRYLQRDGNVVWGRLTCSVVRFGGDEHYAVAMVEDITDQKKVRKALKESRKTLRLAVDAAGMSVWDINLSDGTINWIVEDDRFKNILGYSGRATLDAMFFKVHPEDRADLSGAIREAARQNGSYNIEHRVIGENGDVHWLESWGQAYPATTGRRAHIVGLSLDITSRKEAEKELREARQKAEKASRLKSDLLTNMGHEVRTPLTAIRGFVDILRDEVSEEGQEYVHLLQSSVRRLDRTLISVLELTRLERTIEKPELEDVDVAQRLQKAAGMYRTQAEEKGLSMRLEVAEDVPPVRAHPQAVDRVLDNLLSNALKFTSDGEIKLGAEQQEDRVIVFVSDTGIGITEEFMPLIFDEFTQESRGEQRQFTGAGLGLAVTKRLVEQMGGEIIVESAKGEGTTAWVVLPQA